jgi:hypothetical protein
MHTNFFSKLKLIILDSRFPFFVGNGPFLILTDLNSVPS